MAGGVSPRDHKFRLLQDDMIVAEVSGPDRMQCVHEIMHYAAVYARDGPCTVEGITQDDWDAINADRAVVERECR